MVDEKRLEYWNHFIEQWIVEKHGGGVGVTGPRLRQIKHRIMTNDRFWTDIIDRHNGTNRTPEQMKQDDPANYEHCQSNFWGVIVATMGRFGLIK